MTGGAVDFLSIDHSRRGKAAKRKGASGENEVRDLLRAYGWDTAHRNLQSDYRKLCDCGCGLLAPIARRSRPAQGHVVGQPTKFRPGHNKRKVHGLRYVEEDRGYTTPCWIWQGAPAANGYGRVRIGGQRMSAHRFFYTQVRGPVSEGLVLDHLCRVPLCVNPDHLEPVTVAENTRRGDLPVINMQIAQTIRVEHAVYMDLYPLNSKGKPRKRLPQGVLEDMAARYGCSTVTIGNVIAGRAWTAE